MVESTRKEAMAKLMKFINTRSIFPLQEDYDEHFTEAEQYQLLDDLGLRDDLKLFRTENPRKAIYAILNIAAVREKRRLEGKDPCIVSPIRTPWSQYQEQQLQ
ncbi:hypothetical protein IKG07_03435 [Candidatus Saccharibacteria bacterium]|nr:hypothetical protein [Candidatus Saccharibacteria bacterium]